MLHIFIGSDHRGYALKLDIKKWMDDNSIDYTDLGAFSTVSVDYPDIAREVAEKVHETKQFGILICGSGQGMAIAANKVIPGVRAALCPNKTMAEHARKHNNANVCTLGGDYLDKDVAVEIVKTFLNTEFEGGRHEQRIKKIDELGKKMYDESKA